MSTEGIYNRQGRMKRLLSRMWHAPRAITANLRLRNKFFIIFLTVSIIPFSLVIFYSYTTTRDTITDQTYTSLAGTLDQINLNIEGRLDYYNQLSNILYIDAQLRNYLSNNYEQAFYYLDAFQYINRTLPSIMTLNANIQGITIYTDNKTLYTDGQFVKYMEELPEAIKKQALLAAGNTIYTHTSGDGADVLPHLTIARSLSYFSLQFPYGILTFDISDNELNALIEKETRNKDVYIIDGEGQLISAGGEALGSERLFDIYPIGKQLAEFGSGMFDLRIEGKERFFTYKKLSNGWYTVITVPYDELLSNTNKATTRIAWISVIALTAAILLIYVTTKVITKRIEKLLQQIRKVERGDFRLSIKPMGHDEIGQLSFAFNKMASKIESLIGDVYVKEISMKEAELNTLQAQINPHFLYNTLSSISSLAVKEGAMQVYQMVNYLAKYYRVSLNKGKPMVLLEQEINLVKNYVAIQEIRFRGKLRLFYELDQELYKRWTLKLLLQPFIENSINHAIWDESGINIIVKVRQEGDTIVFKVIDDGMGMTISQLEQSFAKRDHASGYGIRNVDDRIKLTYGEQYGVKIYSRLGFGTSVTIRIPLAAELQRGAPEEIG